MLDIIKSILYEFEVQQAGFSLRILVAGEKEAPCERGSMSE